MAHPCVPPSLQGLLEIPIFTDTVVFRVAPWIMTPNTLVPLEVFVCRWVAARGGRILPGSTASSAPCCFTSQCGGQRGLCGGRQCPGRGSQVPRDHLPTAGEPQRPLDPGGCARGLRPPWGAALQLHGAPPSSLLPPQDEVEFGYVQAPHKTFPVVFDSPRDLGLKDFPVKSILVRTGRVLRPPTFLALVRHFTALRQSARR